MNRRDWLLKGLFITTIGSTLAFFGGLLADVWLAAGKFSSARWAEIAPADVLTSDGMASFPEKRAALVRRGRMLAALSLECTHLGCLVSAFDYGFFCPCHGSRFGPLGELYSGPATRGLVWHAIQIRRGSIWIRTGEKLPEPLWIHAGKEPEAVS